MKALFLVADRHFVQIAECDPETQLALDDELMAEQQFTVPFDESGRRRKQWPIEADIPTLINPTA